MRNVIIHYHIFKNAGTSLDTLFKDYFGYRFFEAEFAQHHVTTGNSPLVADWLLKNEKAIVLSSHTAHMPPPDLQDIQIFPVVMLRHPLMRFKSAYLFERKQTDIVTRGVDYARRHDFKGYIERYLATPDNVNCRNYQACRLAVRSSWFSDRLESEAVAAFEKLPFVGVVEAFGPSVNALENWLKPDFPHFKGRVVQENVGDMRSLMLSERLSEIKAELGSALYEELLDKNAIDLMLHERAMERLI